MGWRLAAGKGFGGLAPFFVIYVWRRWGKVECDVHQTRFRRDAAVDIQMESELTMTPVLVDPPTGVDCGIRRGPGANCAT